MPKKKEEELYQDWITEVKSGLAGDELTAFELLLKNEKAAKHVLRGGLRGEDYYTKLNELNDARKALESEKTQIRTAWDEEKPKNERLLKEYNKVKADLEAAQAQLEGLDEDEVPQHMKPPVQDPDRVTREDVDALQRKLEVFDKTLPHLLKDSLAISKKIVQEDWKIEPEAVIDFALTHGVKPQQAFEHLTSEEREARREKDIEARIKKAREEGAREALSTSSVDHVKITGPVFEDLNPKVTTNHRGRVDNSLRAFDAILEATPQ